MGPTINRRTFIVTGAAAAATAAWSPASSLATAAPGSGLRLKGVNFDTDREPELWLPDFVTAEMATIANDLHCNAVIILGHDLDRLIFTAEQAAAHGLYVLLEPRHFDSDATNTLEFVAAVAHAAEGLRAEHPDVVLSVGVELTIFMAGLLPGHDWSERGEALGSTAPAVWNTELNAFLAEALRTVRPIFGGDVTYSSGPWEDVDWSDFDVVGVDMYRHKGNAATFVEDVRALHRHGKPVIITEFGCCTFRGADDAGGLGFEVIDFAATPPVLAKGTVRDERVQADYLDELLTIFEDEGVHGAFIYDFIQPGSPHIPEAPQYDYDTGSFSIVKCYASDHERAYQSTGYFEPKAAFHTVAKRFVG